MWSVECGVWSVQCVKCGVWQVVVISLCWRCCCAGDVVVLAIFFCAGDFVVLVISFVLVILLRRSTLCKLCGTQ